jgi:signal recognition particle subunit SRP72
LVTNILACWAAANFINPHILKNAEMTIEHDTMEIAFNHACVDLSLKNYLKAREWLNLAQKMGEDDDELRDELPMINIQMGFIEQVSGHIPAASAYMEKLATSKVIKDRTRRVVLENNLIGLRGKTHLLESQRRLNRITEETLLNRLPSYQREAIAFNHALLNLHMGKVILSRKEAEKGWKQGTLKTLKPKWLLLICTSLMKEKKTMEAIQWLQRELQKTTTDSMGSSLHLALAQLFLCTYENIDSVIVALQSIPNASTHGKIMKALLICYHISHKIEMAKSYFDPLIKADKLDENTIREYARFLYQNHHIEDAAALYDKLLQKVLPSSPSYDDLSLIAEAIQIYALFQPTVADRLALLLPSETTQKTSSLTPSDVDRLENLPTYKSWSLTKKPATATAVISSQEIDTQMVDDRSLKHKPSLRKKRKNKLPKCYDPNRTPDPERWLPKHRRSTYRDERKKQRKRQEKKPHERLRSTQGTLNASPSNLKNAATSLSTKSKRKIPHRK